MAYHPDITPNPFWSQATWFVDPQNVSGNANDNNSGSSALAPVRSYNGGIVAKWGTKSPTLRQNTSITWMSDANVGNGDPVILTPLMVNAVLTVQGIVDATRIVHSGALAGVVPKVIAADPGEALLQADIGYAEATPVRTIIRNTTVGKESMAWLDLNTAGTTWSLSQPLIIETSPFLGVGPGGEVNTWANGDTFDALHFVTVNIVQVQPLIGEYVAPNFPAQVQIQNINIVGAGGPGNDDLYIGDDTTFIQCGSDACLIARVNEDAESTFYFNCNATQGVFDASGSNYFTTYMGGRIISTFGTVLSWALSHDVICDSSFTPGFDSFSWGQWTRPPNPSFVPQAGSVYIRNTITAYGMLRFDAASSFDGQGRIWGPGTLDTQGLCRVSWVNGVLAVNVFLCATLKLNGLTTAYAVSTGDPAVLHPGRTISATGLDTPVGPGNTFGGLAFQLGGSAYSNQGTA
jgi:hypothetical protein